MQTTPAAETHRSEEDEERRQRRVLHAHCYRMLGSVDEAEDAVAETLLTSERLWDTVDEQGRSLAWLYGIATRQCLETLERTRPRAAAAGRYGPSVAGLPWVQPYPDALLDGDEPYALSLAYITVLQLIPPRQRAAVLLCDVVAMGATEAGDLTSASEPAVTSALQRGRSTLRARNVTAAPSSEPAAEQQRVLEAFVAAWEATSPRALTALLRRDVRLGISPGVGEWNDHSSVASALQVRVMSPGDWRLLPTAANGQPAAVGYQRRRGEDEFLPAVVWVLDVRDGGLAGIAGFEEPGLVTTLGLPERLEEPAG